MILHRTLFLAALAAGLALGLAGCGGGHASATAAPAPPPAAAAGLVYTDPAGTGWRLVQDAASTPTRLLLNLVGPAGFNSRGAGFNLQVPASVHIGTFPETQMPIKDLGVYELRGITTNNYHGPNEPKILVGGVKPGNLLTVSEFQKDRQLAAKDSGAPLFQIALEFDAAAHLATGAALHLAVVKAKYMAEDIGAYYPAPTPEIAAKAHLLDMTIAVGTLIAK